MFVWATSSVTIVESDVREKKKEEEEINLIDCCGKGEKAETSIINCDYMPKMK